MTSTTLNKSERAAYTPDEFAKLFGRERTWTYRQIYKGKIKPIKGFGSLLIPAKEVENIIEKGTSVR